MAYTELSERMVGSCIFSDTKKSNPYNCLNKRNSADGINFLCGAETGGAETSSSKTVKFRPIVVVAVSKNGICQSLANELCIEALSVPR